MLGGGGIRVQSNAQSCSDPCDPNSCMQIGEGPGDVDAAGVAVTEAGVSIPPTIPQGGGTGDGGTCRGLQCQVDWTCPMGSQTTLTGTVYDPAGINPLYNAYVYIPVDPSGNLPAFSTGASCDPCSGSGSLNAVNVAQTDVYGHFTLVNVPTTALAPHNSIPLVVQMGKWRRMIMLSSVPDCATTAVSPSNSRLPQNKFDGYNNTADIPRMAIATGNVDPMECMMLKMGIDPAEFQIPGTGTRRIDYYVANGQGIASGTAPPLSSLAGSGSCSTASCYQNSDCSTGSCNSGSMGKCSMQAGMTCTSGTQCASGSCSSTSHTCRTPPSCRPGVAGQCGSVETCTGGTLGNCTCSAKSDCGSSGGTCNTSPLPGYDVVLLPCEGFEDDSNDAYATNIANYALAGGRLFTTHYGYTWLSTPTAGVANATNPSTGVANPFYGVANWNLNNYSYGSAGAQIDTNFPKGLAFEQWMDNINAATNGALTLDSPRHDVDSVNASYATEWMHHSSSPNETFHFTFNTPLGAGIGDAGADSGAGVCGRVVYSDFHVSGTALVSGTSCASNADCGYGATCSGGTYGTCSGQTCKTVSDCSDPNFACNSVLGKCGCTKNSDCSTMAAGTCSGATPSSCGCYTNTDCSSMGAGTCQNVTDGKCGCYENSDCTALGAGTCSGATHGTCSTKSCYVNSDCSAAGEGVCHSSAAGSCSLGTCYQNSDCGSGTGTCSGGSLGTCAMQSGKSCTSGAQCKSGSCGNNGKCKNEPSCDPAVANSCGSVETCSGATAGTCGCYKTADCTAMGAGTCSGSSKGYCGCYESTDCAALGGGSCSGASPGKCTSATCATNADCSAAGSGTCNGAVAGACSLATCFSGSDCTAGNNKCTGTPVTGQCTTATCSSNSSCTSGTRVCTGYQSGTCQPNTCTSNLNCGATRYGQERCSNGTCSGCSSNSDCPGSFSTCNGGTTGTCSGNASQFPNSCAQGRLTPQESALEFMLLDLTACISPDSSPPPAPPAPVTSYSPVTFTEDFTSTCPMGTHVVWRELDWQASIPSTASIVFSAQTVEAPTDGAAPNYSAAQSVQVAKATTSTTLPGWDAALIDATGNDAGLVGAFNSASPAVKSGSALRLTITLNPTSDMKATPTLIQWQVKSDCPPSE
jgi:hypothetical protein